jgi:hypothetical protein
VTFISYVVIDESTYQGVVVVAVVVVVSALRESFPSSWSVA